MHNEIFCSLLFLSTTLASGEIQLTNYPKQLSCDDSASSKFTLEWLMPKDIEAGDKLSVTLRENAFDTGDVLANPLIFDFGTVDYQTTSLDLVVPREVGSKLPEASTINALILIVKVNDTSFNSSPKSCFASICIGFDKTFPFTCGSAQPATPDSTQPGECRGKAGCKCLDGECPDFPPGLSCGFFDNTCTTSEPMGAELGQCKSDNTCDSPLECVAGWCMKAGCTWPVQTSYAECPCGLHSDKSMRCEPGSSCPHFGSKCTPKQNSTSTSMAPPENLICNGKELNAFSLEGGTTLVKLLACFDASAEKCGDKESCECAELLHNCYRENNCETSKSVMELCRKLKCGSFCSSAVAVSLSITAIASSLVVALSF